MTRSVARSCVTVWCTRRGRKSYRPMAGYCRLKKGPKLSLGKKKGKLIEEPRGRSRGWIIQRDYNSGHLKCFWLKQNGNLYLLLVLLKLLFHSVTPPKSAAQLVPRTRLTTYGKLLVSTVLHQLYIRKSWVPWLALMLKWHVSSHGSAKSTLTQCGPLHVHPPYLGKVYESFSNSTVAQSNLSNEVYTTWDIKRELQSGRLS